MDSQGIGFGPCDVTDDRIQSDHVGGPHPQAGGPYVDGQGAEVYMMPSGNIRLDLREEGQRMLSLDLSQPVPGTEKNCPATGTPRPFTQGFVDSFSATYSNLFDVPTDDTLRGMAVGQVATAGFSVALFTRDNATWSVNFDNNDVPAGDRVTVTRLDANNWVIEAFATDNGNPPKPTARARLSCTPNKGRPQKTQLGLYNIPFKLRVFCATCQLP